MIKTIEKLKKKIKTYFAIKKINKINIKIINYEKDSYDKRQINFIYNSSILREDNSNI